MRAFFFQSRSRLHLCRIFAFFFFASSPSWADGISFQLDSSSLTAASSGTVTFTGTVTTASGADLNASDFFFNFFGFDPTSLDPIQDLGVVTDFPIPNGSTTADVSLFDVTMLSVPAGSSFSMEVQLEDVNLDTSAIETVTVTVPGTQPVSEPHTLLLLGSGLVPLALWKLRRA